MSQAEKIDIDEEDDLLTDQEIHDDEEVNREKQAQKRACEKLAARYKSLEEQKLALDQEALLAGMTHLQMKHDKQNLLFSETSKENTVIDDGGGGQGGSSGQRNGQRSGGEREGGSRQRGSGGRYRHSGREQRARGDDGNGSRQQRGHGRGGDGDRYGQRRGGGQQTRGPLGSNHDSNYNGVAKNNQPLSNNRLVRKLEHEIIELKRKLQNSGRVIHVNNNY